MQVFNTLVQHMEHSDHWEGAARFYGYYYAFGLFVLLLIKATAESHYVCQVQVWSCSHIC